MKIDVGALRKKYGPQWVCSKYWHTFPADEIERHPNGRDGSIMCPLCHYTGGFTEGHPQVIALLDAYEAILHEHSKEAN